MKTRALLGKWQNIYVETRYQYDNISYLDVFLFFSVLVLLNNNENKKDPNIMHAHIKSQWSVENSFKKKKKWSVEKFYFSQCQSHVRHHHRCHLIASQFPVFNVVLDIIDIVDFGDERGELPRVENPCIILLYTERK